MTKVVEEVDPGELQEAPLPSRSALVRGLVVFVMFCAFVPSVLGLLGRWGWLLDLCNHFRFQCAAVLLATTLGLLLLRSWRMTGFSAVGLIVNLVFVMQLYLGSPGESDPGRQTMTVMHYNVHTGNKDYARVIGEVESRRPDLLFVQEVSHQWIEEIEAGLGSYALIAAEPRTDNFGIACFVRVPGVEGGAITITDSRTFDPTNGLAQVPVIEVTLDWEGQAVTVLSIHPLPPVSMDYARERNATLEAAGEWSVNQQTPHVIIGDFNATPWSTVFRDLQSTGNLVNSQVGFGRAPTWPAGFITLGMIPIDHLLHSEDLVTVDRTIGGANGSDHLPLVVEIGWKR